MPKLIYKTFHYRLIYIKPDRILKVIKDVGILINKVEVLEYHYKLYILSKSIYVISYTPFILTVCCFVEIYVDIIKYKLLLINNYKYITWMTNERDRQASETLFCIVHLHRTLPSITL